MDNKMNQKVIEARLEELILIINSACVDRPARKLSPVALSKKTAPVRTPPTPSVAPSAGDNLLYAFPTVSVDGDGLEETLNYLRASIKYLALDLEAVRRENQAIKDVLTKGR